jgi:hypothetical protein
MRALQLVYSVLRVALGSVFVNHVHRLIDAYIQKVVTLPVRNHHQTERPFTGDDNPFPAKRKVDFLGYLKTAAAQNGAVTVEKQQRQRRPFFGVDVAPLEVGQKQAFVIDHTGQIHGGVFTDVTYGALEAVGFTMSQDRARLGGARVGNPRALRSRCRGS